MNGRRFLAILMFVSPAIASAQPASPQSTRSGPTTPDLGRAAEANDIGVGERQSREVLDRQIGTPPMARINNRIMNRVQSRLRNRIDRTYDPRANAASPFVVAEDRVRTINPPR